MGFHRIHRIWKATALLSLAAGGATGLGAREKSAEPSISLEPLAAVAVGMAREIVNYPSGFDQVPDYLSELRWDLKPAVLIGYVLGADWRRAGRYHFEIQTALPMRSGFMEDRDWMYWNRSDITHYSLHEISIDTALVIDIGGAWTVASVRNWDFSLTAGYHLDYWKWTDALVESRHVSFYSIREYSDGDELIPEEATPGDGEDSIHYRVGYHVLYAGVRAGYAKAAFSAEASLSAGPVYASAWDHHFGSRYYHDRGFGGPWTTAGLRIAVGAGSSGAVVVDAEYVWMFEFKGRTDEYTESMIYLGTSNSRPGFQFRRFRGAVGYRFRF